MDTEEELRVRSQRRVDDAIPIHLPEDLRNDVVHPPHQAAPSPLAPSGLQDQAFSLAESAPNALCDAAPMTPNANKKTVASDTVSRFIRILLSRGNLSAVC